MSEMLLQIDSLTKHFPVEKGFLSSILAKESKVVHAVDEVSFNIMKDETFSLVGETGSGKTTTAKLILRLIEPTSGDVRFEGRSIFKLEKDELRKLRSNMQIIFQDPFASLNPRETAGEIIGAPFKIQGLMSKSDRRKAVLELLNMVGLEPAPMCFDKYPHEFSGGQRQRIGIARALALRPKFIVADEPVASLDVSIRSQILDLMQNLKKQLKLTYLMISHDLSVVRYMSDRVAVMYLGKIAELAEARKIFSSPKHPYTKALISAVPIPDPKVKMQDVLLKGEIPSPINPPTGCRFHTRCPIAKDVCSEREPALVEVDREHLVACHFSQ